MYPIWCGCVPSHSVLCCLLAPLLAPSVWLVSLCVLCFGLSPLFYLLPPMMAGFSLVVFVSSGLPVAWILRLPLCVIALSSHLIYIGLIIRNFEFVCGMAISCHRPPLSVVPILCLFVLLGSLNHVTFSLAIWGGPFSLCFVSASSPGGEVDPR